MIQLVNLNYQGHSICKVLVKDFGDCSLST